MAITIECRFKSKELNKLCRTHNALGSQRCRRCNSKLKDRVYIIEWRENGKKKRERIGSSKESAETRLAEIKRAMIEDRYLDKDKGAKLPLESLIQWYLSLEEVQFKKSFKRDIQLLSSIMRIIGKDILIKDLNQGLMKLYATKRLKEDSPSKLGQKIKKATVNKERMQLNTVLNKAVEYQKILRNPLAGKIKKLPEDNVRDRVLSEIEFENLLENLFSPLREMAIVAYYLGMRQKEILNLTWDHIDQEKNLIVLLGEETKSGFGRKIPIHPKVKKVLKEFPRATNTNKVFHKNGKALNTFSGNYKRQWNSAVLKAKLGDFTFHDLRHCAINNLRLAGNDHFTIMAISGHKTNSVFKRYNLVTEEELQKVSWKKEAIRVGV